MKLKLIALILLTVFLVSCGPDETPEPQEETQEEVSQPTSECDRIQDPSRKIRCQAWEAKDMSMCADIPSARFKEDCVVAAAELVQDDSQLSHCSIAQGENNRIICQALVKKDADVCFTMQDRADTRSDLSMRDCVDLVARKLQDESICDLFSSRAQVFVDVCGGATSDCEGLWISGIDYNVQTCKENIQ